MTYEYLCTACGHEWEAEQSISDKPLKKCPKCSKLQAKRQVSGGAGFLLKGGGWYADGYGSSSPRKDSSSSESSSGDKKPDKKSEDTSKSSPAKESKAEKSKTEKSGKTAA